MSSRITEKKYLSIFPLSLTADGGKFGQVQVPSTLGFHVKMEVILKDNLGKTQKYEVKRVVSLTELWVGPKGNIQTLADISQFTTANGATIEAPEQSRPAIPYQEHENAVFAAEPIIAKRSILVDQFGDYFSTGNPVPVQLSDGSINIGTVNGELEVQLSHKDNDPDSGDVHDSTRIGDGDEELEINPDGSINVNLTPSNTSVSLTSEYNEVSSVPTATPTTVSSYTAPVGKTSYLHKVFVSGDNIAKYRVRLNGTIIDQNRTYFGGSLNSKFNFSKDSSSGKLLSSGDVVEVEVEHNRPSVGDFNARIQAIEI